jgi:hypothetical protein
VGKRDRQRHEFGCLIAGEPDHHALVAGADTIVSVDLLTGANLDRVRHSAQDLRALVLDCDHHSAGVGVETVLGMGVPDFFDGGPNNGRNVDV